MHRLFLNKTGRKREKGRGEGEKWKSAEARTGRIREREKKSGYFTILIILYLEQKVVR